MTRIERFKNRLEQANGNKSDMMNVISDIKMALASHVLGRKFGEDPEEFLNRKPELKAFKEWTKSIELDKNYNLIKY